MPDPEDVLGQDPEPNSQPKPEPKVEPQAKPTDWESAYKGLQKVVDKLNKKLSDVTEKYDALVEEHETLKQQTKNDASSVDGLKGQLTQKDLEIQRLQGEVNKAASNATRTKIIMIDYPELAPFEGSGLLPEAATEEEIKEKLDKFKEALGKTVGDQVLQKIRGAGPGTGPKKDTVELTEDQVYDRMVALAGTNDPALKKEYNELLEKWHALRG